MDWIRENLFWIIFGVLFLWMHTKMHAGHGGHGGHAGHDGGGHGAHEARGEHAPDPERRGKRR